MRQRYLDSLPRDTRKEHFLVQDQNTESSTGRQPRTLVIKLPRFPRWPISLLLIGLISFGIAYGVVEWRGGTSIRGCEATAYEKYLNEYELWLGQTPDAPYPPSQSASDFQWDTYEGDFRQYRDDFKAHQNEGIQADRDWIADMRECL